MRSFRKLLLVNVVLFALLIAGLIAGGVAIYNSNTYVDAEASVTGPEVSVRAAASGLLSSWNVKQGQSVTAGEVIGAVEVRSRTNATRVLSPVRAPISGDIVRVTAVRGQQANPSQTLATIIDLSHLELTADISEKDIRNVRMGQLVDITYDSEPGIQMKGRVGSIGLTTLSVFAMVPEKPPGSTNTRIEQRIPVTINLAASNFPLMPGASASVRIHRS